jgi:4-hydroxy-tetrahydrodipicolinate synthase
LAAFATGATGWTTGIANTIPNLCVAVFEEAVNRRNFDEARKIFNRILPLCDFYAEKSLCRSVKAAAEIMDKPLGPPRLPLQRLAQADYQTLRELLIRCGVLEPRHVLRKV